MSIKRPQKKFVKDDIKTPQEIQKMSANYIEQILEEIQRNMKQGIEYDKVTRDFKKFATHFMRKHE